jgi:ABC-type lipoprotein release transport system permease subunit
MATSVFRLARIGAANLWRNPRRTMITASALAIGMIMLAFTVSLMAGVTRDLIEEGTGLLLGHVQVHARGYRPDRSIFDTIPGDGRALAKRLEGMPGVVAVAPRATGYGLVSAGEKSAGAELLGIEPAAEARVSELQNRLAAGRGLLTGRARNEVLIGDRLAGTLGVVPGDELVLLTQAADGSLGNDVYRLAGLFDTGAVGVDDALVVLRLSDLQDLLALPRERIHEIALRAVTATGAPGVADRLATELADDVEVAAWPALAPEIAGYVAMSDGWLWIMYVIVLGLASVAVLNTMLMAVFERFHEFGVLAAIGMRPLQILLLVATEVAGLAVLGLTVAVVLGTPLLRWLVHSGIDLRNLTEGFAMSGVTLRPIMRGAWTPGRFVESALLLITLALLAGLYPAARAARVDPAVLTRGELR